MKLTDIQGFVEAAERATGEYTAFGMYISRKGFGGESGIEIYVYQMGTGHQYFPSLNAAVERLKQLAGDTQQSTGDVE